MTLIHRLLFPLCICLALSSPAFPETRISGDISKTVFDTVNNPYIVDNDLIVPQEDMAVIPAGIVFLFKPFTGINVNGSLRVEGKPELPVIFTSINESKYNAQAEQLPNPFDWNGIQVLQTAKSAVLQHFILTYSVYGIKTGTDSISVIDGLFRQNGQFHFTIGNKIVQVQDNIPFTCKDGAECLYLTSGAAPGAKNADTLPAKKPAVNWRIITSAGAGVLGIGAGVVGIMRCVKAVANYDSAGMSFPDNNRNDTYYSNYQRFYKQSFAAFVGSGICFGAAAYLYFFHFKEPEKQHAYFTPYFNPDGKFGLTMELRW